MKTLSIAWQLLWANRWLWLLLALWPWGMAALLLAGGHPPTPDDAAAVFEQEAIYGLALVAFAGGALLGNEQRSRRIALVLSRAVSRRQYLGALWLAAYLPLLVYAAEIALTAPLVQPHDSVLVQVLGALLLLGGVLASLAVLGSVVLPAALAGVVSLALLCLPMLLPEHLQTALSRLLQIVMNGPSTEHATHMFVMASAEATVVALAAFELAVRIFDRRDLRLKSE